jgi:hypothetical protein
MPKQGSFIHPDHLRDVWPQVRPYVEKACAKDWRRRIPEDVYALCITGKGAFYVLSDDDGALTGFVVLSVQEQFGRRFMSVEWAGHSDPNATCADYWDWVLDTARAAGVKSVVIEGPRAYDRVLRGARLINCQYEAEVPDGQG